MLPLVSNDAVAILFMFDLTRKATLNSVKEWYRQARGFNKVREGNYVIDQPLTTPSIDRYTCPHRHKIRHIRLIITRRTGGDHETSQAILQGYARTAGMRLYWWCIRTCMLKGYSDFLFYISFHQCAEDLQDCFGESI